MGWAWFVLKWWLIFVAISFVFVAISFVGLCLISACEWFIRTRLPFARWRKSRAPKGVNILRELTRLRRIRERPEAEGRGSGAPGI